MNIVITPEHLVKIGFVQPKQHTIIICNGSEVSAEIKRLLPPPNGTPANATSYHHKTNERSVVVVLSGFIGRIDNYSKRRLGQEIDLFLTELSREG